MRLRTLVASVLAVVSLPVFAGERGADQVSAFAGSFSQGIPIQVPGFRGLEPRLSLGYSSEGRNGQLGVGWSLSGFSMIERTNAGGGTPRFDATDTYTLDGQKLMACPVGTVSPGCTSGGSHATETESYIRILQTGSNTWEVTGRDGTKTTYTSLIAFTPGTWRWGVSSVVDTLGNTVAYSWSCPGGGDGDCYPSSVSYNGYSITIHKESRPDTRSFGSYDELRNSNYRLLSILVKVGAQNIRAYKLSYGTSALTDRSLLTSVQLFGKDVVIDGNGVITGGTSLPAQTFAYSTEPAGKVFVGEDTPPTPPGTTEAVSFTNLETVTATGTGTTILKDGGGFAWSAGASSTRALDAGDGFAEWTHAGGKYAVGLSNGDGDATRNDIDFAIVTSAGTADVWEAGVNKASTSIAVGDVFRVEVAGGQVLYKRNGATFYTNAAPALNYPLLVDSSIYDRPLTIGPVSLSGALEDVAFWCNEVLIPADVNGDGLSDQACFSSVGEGFVNVRLATADGFAPPQTWLSGKKFKRAMLGDFNADGKLDVADHATLGGAVSVGLSDGSSFATPVSWGVASDPGGGLCAGNSGDTFNVATGDFNGDGLTDVSCRKFGTPGIYVGLSDGSAFSFSRWVNLSCDEQNYYSSGASDFDGDGKDDYWCVGSTGNFAVWVSTGSGLEQGVFTSLPSFSTSPAFADLNGDGKTDLANKNGKVALSNGKAFTVLGTSDGWCQYSQVIAADVDGDGASELLCNKNGTPPNDIQVRKWKAGALAAAETWKGSWCGGQVFASDYDGDGKTDLLCNEQAATRAIAGTSSTTADLLVSIGNGLGGTTQVAYVPGTVFHDPTANTPVVKNVVAQITTLDGRGGSSMRSYSYSGALYNSVERRFMGFRYMRETLPCITGESMCPYNEVWLMQTLHSAGMPEELHRRDGQGRLLSSKRYDYVTNGATVPRTSLLASEWSYLGDGTLTAWPTNWPNTVAKRTRSEYAYDAHGNRAEIVSYGDYDLAGDETTTVLDFRPNTSAFITGAVARSRTFAGASTLGALLTEARSLYDGGVSWETSPTAGLLTTSQAWLDTESRFVTKSYGYDEYGNRTSETDETNRATTTSYDLIHHAFPISKTNNAGETQATSWDPVCAVPVSSLDLNGQGASLQTDALCRTTRVDFPLGNFRETSYLSLGDPNEQRVRVEKPSASSGDGTGNDYFTTYVDGLGRPYLAIGKGPSPSQPINTETVFNARGSVSRQTASYYSGDAKYWTTYEYDSFDRTTRVILPDGNDVENEYGLLFATNIDPNNKAVTSRFDMFGRTIEKATSLNGAQVVTRLTYDLLGRTSGMEDAVGAVWVYSIDSLGRNYARDDPDAGRWTFEFDDAGRQVATEDAKGQRTEFTHDAAGRLQTKTLVGTPNYVSTLAYGEARPGSYNLGRLTTVTSPNDVLRLDYDAAGRVAKQERVIDGSTMVIQRRYDSMGRVLGTTYPDGDAMGTVANPLLYDAAGRLKGIPGIVSNVTYDASGRPLVQTNTNGTVTTRSYDPERGFLTNIHTVGTSVIQQLAYNVDATGLVEGVVSPFANESWTYTHDELYRLTHATNTSNPGESQTWTYDQLGRITYNSRVGTYGYPAPGEARPHAPMTAGTNTYSYDPNGNLLSGGGRTITWTAENLISSVSDSNGTTAFTYDGFGERLKKEAGSNPTYYPFGDDFETNGAMATKYVSVPGIGVVAKRVNSTNYWLHTDRLGSVVAITDATGGLAQRRSFRPYGETIACETGFAESRGWIDQRTDPETGLTYLHARYYDPILAVFMSPDPSSPWLPGVGSNRYGYGFGNPLTGADRWGLRWTYTCGSFGEDSVCGWGWQPDPWEYDYGSYRVPTGPGPGEGPAGTEGPATPPSGGPHGPQPTPTPEPSPSPSPAPSPTPSPNPSPNPTPKPPPGPKKKLKNALKDAWSRLGQANCNGFFGGDGRANLSAAAQQIQFENLGSDGPAANSDGGIIRLNTAGPFMNDGFTTANFPGASGRLSFSDNSAFSSFILLHELAHLDSMDTAFLPDHRNPGLTLANSERLHRACY